MSITLIHRGRHGDLGTTNGFAPSTDLAHEQPTGRAVDQAVVIVDLETTAGVLRVTGHDGPTLRHIDLELGFRLGAILEISTDRRHQIIRAEQRPIGCYVPVVAPIAALAFQLDIVLQPGVFIRRRPQRFIALHR